MSNILLGVSAGIAAYKSADLASKLTQRGDTVRTILTPGAQKFITPLTFGAVTRQEVFTDIFEDEPAYKGEHSSLSQWADLLLIAPAFVGNVGFLPDLSTTGDENNAVAFNSTMQTPEHWLGWASQ